MRPDSFLFATLGAVLIPGTLGHNVEGILLVNGTETPEWKYVLDVEGPEPFQPDDRLPPGWQGYKVNPIIGPDNPNVTCGRGAFKAAMRTETADVLAGSKVGFRVSTDGGGTRNSGDTTRQPTFYHPGPAQVYLSRAPNDDLLHYRGDGDWFKIAYAGPVNSTNWSLWPRVSDFNFTIPKTTPPGRYLMRIENLYPTASSGFQQFYVNCALVNIMGPGGGTPKGFARFPGTYQTDDPGILVPPNQDLLGGPVELEDMRLLEYKAPGPPVWTG